METGSEDAVTRQLRACDDAEGCYQLGERYRRGDEGKKDWAAAAVCYQKAALQGHEQAMYALALSYEGGYGVPADEGQAEYWLKKAVALGYVEALHKLALLYKYKRQPDHVRAADCFLQAAQQGHANAQYSLGICYKFGRGLERNHKEAAAWFRKAARQGLAAAQYALGICCQNGQGVEKNLDEARFWFRQAAAQGDRDAASRLARLG